MWMPREPEVLGQPTSPTASSASATAERHVADLRPRHARHRVEVDPQLVGVVEVVGADRVRVEVDAAEVGDPREPRRVVEDDLVGGASRRERQLRGPDPVRAVVRGALLEERLAGGAVDEALQRHRPAADPAQRPVGDREVVLDEVELRVAGLREVDLGRVRDRDLAAADLEDLLRRRHGRHDTARQPQRPRRMMRAPTATHEGRRAQRARTRLSVIADISGLHQLPRRRRARPRPGHPGRPDGHRRDGRSGRPSGWPSSRATPPSSTRSPRPSTARRSRTPSSGPTSRSGAACATSARRRSATATPACGCRPST